MSEFLLGYLPVVILFGLALGLSLALLLKSRHMSVGLMLLTIHV